MKALLGLAGQARSGKDTVASIVETILKEEVPELHIHRDAFANRLKRSAANALGYKFDTIEEYRDWSDHIKENCEVTVVDVQGNGKHTENKISGRQFLQFYGTEAHREIFGSEFWVEALLENPPECDVLVITDVRFPNEAEAIRELGGEVWEIRRPETSAEPTHASEQPLSDDLIDFRILNDRGLDELGELVRELLDG